ncbi:collagen alpha-2(I) chain-like [Macaca nemestrina]|uniref:collagen alpha-2(I) chain-like n=1 Tax=Macaca nemestrina TaxID=9545 RepID=UPI0039B9727A
MALQPGRKPPDSAAGPAGPLRPRYRQDGVTVTFQVSRQLRSANGSPWVPGGARLPEAKRSQLGPGRQSLRVVVGRGSNGASAGEGENGSGPGPGPVEPARKPGAGGVGRPSPLRLQ